MRNMHAENSKVRELHGGEEVLVNDVVRSSAQHEQRADAGHLRLLQHRPERPHLLLRMHAVVQWLRNGAPQTGSSAVVAVGMLSHNR